MSELSPSKSAGQQDDNSTDSDVSRNWTLFEGRCRLKSVFLIDTSRGVGAGTSHVKFKNGGASGDVLLTLYPTLTPIYYAVYNSQGLFVELPGNGILFPDGLYLNTVLESVTSGSLTKVRALSVTAIYS